ncbi:purple acid phosphatase family protein [Planctomicrobium sp. SH661]|uniref:purple acid phosphatase family protein n=1 Tax=Planctomicrobium sp. SH661 TaxID=3448124 RepID=UPI003F5C1679
MQTWKRREFLGSTLAGLSAGLFAGSPLTMAKSSSKEQEKLPGNPVSGPDTLFLTWQADPCTSMTIQWLDAEGSSDQMIEFSPFGEDRWGRMTVRLKEYPGTDLKVHRADLSGLRPGTEYQFRIGRQGPISRFRTMPAKSTDVIQFVSGGDVGTNEHSIRTNLLAAKQDPRFALIGGDLAYDNGKSPDTFTRFLRNYRAGMVDSEGRLIPMISCIGNHEVEGGYNASRKQSPQYLSVFDGLYHETTYGVLDIGDYLSLVLLDTGHISPIDGEQTSWLEKTLADRRECPHLIVVNHVPAYPSYRGATSSSGKPGTGHLQRELWCPLFERYKVDVVLEHHDHTFKRTHPLTNGLYDKHGVIYLGDGSWGQLRALKDPENRPYLARASSQYHMTVHRLEGDDRFHVALEESGKVADVCHTVSKRASR